MSSGSTSLGILPQRPLIAINADIDAAQALATAQAHHIHHLPVMLDGALVGLACTCNLQAASPDARVDTLMSHPAVTLQHDATFDDAVAAMNTHDVGSVILVENSHPSGIVTRGDLLLAAPELCLHLNKQRCNCCGLTRHLLTAPDGQTLCIHCFEPGADGRVTHMSQE